MIKQLICWLKTGHKNRKPIKLIGRYIDDERMKVLVKYECKDCGAKFNKWVIDKAGWYDTKIHAEFLEELKKYIDRELNKYSPISVSYCMGNTRQYRNILEKIEQFQAEQKQVNDAKE